MRALMNRLWPAAVGLQPVARNASQDGRCAGTRCHAARRLAGRLLWLLPLLLTTSGCEQLAPTTRKVTRLEKAETPGQVDLLMIEDERTDFGGRLQRYMSATDPKTRARAALSAGRMRYLPVEQQLTELAADPVKEVRANAAWALGRLGTESAQQTLVGLLDDESADVQKAAIHGLGLAPDGPLPDAVYTRVQGLQDSPVARALLKATLQAAGQRRDTRVLPLAVWAVGHPDPEIRWHGAWLLSELADPAGLEALRSALADPDPRTRAFAARGLGRLRDGESAAALIAALDDLDASVSAEAAGALAALRSDAAAEPLGRLATSGQGHRRWGALRALAETGLNPGVLQQLVSDQSAWVRALAVEGLSRAGRLRPLRRAADDPDWRVRKAVAQGFARRGRADLLQDMQYDEDARVVPAVLEGLARTGASDLRTILHKHLEDGDVFVRATAARLLREHGNRDSLSNLIYSLERWKLDLEPEARIAIIDTLAALAPGNPDVIKQIKLNAIAKNWVLRKHAYALLERLDATGELQPPDQVRSLRTESYYGYILSQAEFDYKATLETDKGTLVFRLYPKSTPLSVAHFESLADRHVYDGTPLFALEPGVGLFAGDPRGDGLGYVPGWVRDEPSLEPFKGLSIGFVHGDEPDSATSVFFISYLPRPELWGRAVMLGELMEGAEVLPQLEAGDLIRSLRVSRHEFTGEFVARVVELDPTPPPQPAGALIDPDAPPLPTPSEEPALDLFERPPLYLYMAGFNLLVLAIGVLPLALSGSRREEYPMAMWIVIGIMCAICFLLLAWTLSGHLHDQLHSPWPGPKKPGEPNPPKMSSATATLVGYGVLLYVMAECVVIFMLAMGRPAARWIALFWCLLEIVVLTGGIHFKVHTIILNFCIALNLIKGWFLLMDARTSRYFAGR